MAEIAAAGTVCLLAESSAVAAGAVVEIGAAAAEIAAAEIVAVGEVVEIAAAGAETAAVEIAAAAEIAEVAAPVAADGRVGEVQVDLQRNC